MLRFIHVLVSAWSKSVRPAHGGARVVVTRPGWSGCFGEVFNPSPLPDGRWVVLLATDSGSQYSPFGDAFVKLYRWEFAII